MATVVDAREAKRRLSELLARARAGEEIVIAEAGRLCVRLAPILQQARDRRNRKPGLLKGKLIGDVLSGLDEEERARWA